MLRNITFGVIAGPLAALLAAFVEPVGATGAPYLPTVAAAAGLLLPVGLLIGLGLMALRGLLPKRHRPMELLEILTSKDAPAASATIFVVGLLVLALLAVGYRLIFFFLTSFNHPGLAAMTLAVVLAVVMLISVVCGRRLANLVTRLLERLSVRGRFFRRPLVALAFVAGCWCAALIPAIATGPQATGTFGFGGLLMKDGLGARPVISLGAITGLAALIAWPLLARPRQWLMWIAGGLLLLALAGPFVTHSIVIRMPGILDRLDTAGALSPWVGQLLRRLGDADADGYARWLGGRDCDDQNPEIHPAARDIPDNCVDEDCSGGDLELAALTAAKRSQQPEIESDTAAEPLRRPDLPENVNLLLITVDSLRWNAPGFMGYERDTTPNLDALIDRGATVYDRAYALGSYTGQAIPPMLTGKYASELKRTDRHEVRIYQSETFAAELVCSKEVRCGAVMSHFLFRPQFGWNQGFHDWEVVSAAPPGPGHIDNKYNSHFVTNRAIDWLKKPDNTATRFWFWAHYMDPHKEYLSHKGIERFGTDRRAMYDHEVRFTDYHIGRLLDFFFTLPAAQHTVIIVSADHGEAFGEHGRQTHGKELWDEIIRVPLAVVGPGVARKRIARQTSLIDMFPTILDLFGADIPEGIHGQSLLVDWVDGQELSARPIIADQPRNPYYETRRVFIHNGWKLHHLPDTGNWRLYRSDDEYEKGDSLVEAEPKRFAEIKAAYELFLAREFEPMAPVRITPANKTD